jgi:hypothetical protein
MDNYILIVAITPIILTLGMVGLMRHLKNLALKEYEK